MALRRGRAWGNALGGWKKQARAANGRFGRGSGGSSKKSGPKTKTASKAASKSKSKSGPKSKTASKSTAKKRKSSPKRTKKKSPYANTASMVRMRAIQGAAIGIGALSVYGMVDDAWSQNIESRNLKEVRKSMNSGIKSISVGTGIQTNYKAKTHTKASDLARVKQMYSSSYGAVRRR